MNEVMNAILTRRSIRKFTDAPIPRDILEELVNAGLHAPDMIARLTDLIGSELARENYDMYRPTAIIMPSNIRDGIWSREDNACALENIFLAAHSLGIGSVWINQMQDICDRPQVRALLEEMGVPADHVVFGMAALGYPAPDAPVTPIKRIGQVAWIE